MEMKKKKNQTFIAARMIHWNKIIDANFDLTSVFFRGKINELWCIVD